MTVRRAAPAFLLLAMVSCAGQPPPAATASDVLPGLRLFESPFGFALDDVPADRWQEFFFGSDILVAPVTRPRVSVLDVRLPAGKWASFWDHRVVLTGGTAVRTEAGIGTIPAFIREGAVVPMGDIVRLNNTWTPDWQSSLSILAFPSTARAGSFTYRTDALTATLAVEAAGSEISFTSDPLGVAWTELRVLCGKPQAVIVNGEDAGADRWSWDDEDQEVLVSLDGRRANSVVLRGASLRGG